MIIADLKYKERYMSNEGTRVRDGIMSDRNEFVDELRGIAIMRVVLGYIIQYVYALQAYDENIIFRAIYSFHMPLFLAISGYVLGFSKHKSSISRHLKR